MKTLSKHFRSLLLALLASALPALALASFPATPTKQWAMSGGTGLWTSSLNEACLSFKSVGGVAPTTSLASVTEATNLCRWMTAEGDPYSTSVTTQNTNLCPSNSTQAGTTCTCVSSYVEEGGTCVLPSVCDVGESRTFNRTEGWARSSNADANDLVSGSTELSSLAANDGVCVGSIVGIDRCYRSQEPTAQGLYRVSCDYTMVMTGDSPAGSEVPETDPTTPDATCPGFVGQVQGKSVCVGTTSTPLPTPLPSPDQPTAAGNPTAGVKPSTGEGSGSDGAGRTPSAGSGGNAGGPASSAVGAGGTGVRDSDGPEPTGAVCGASPLPPCAVKVDETGTPNGSTFGTSSELDTALDIRESALATARDKAGDASWGIVPAWTADQACEPWDVFTLPEQVGGQVVTVDLCPLMPLAEGILNFIWAMLGIFAVTSMVSSAMTGKGT